MRVIIISIIIIFIIIIIIDIIIIIIISIIVILSSSSLLLCDGDARAVTIVKLDGDFNCPSQWDPKRGDPTKQSPKSHHLVTWKLLFFPDPHFSDPPPFGGQG